MIRFIFCRPSYVCMFFVSADKYLTCFLCTVLNLNIFLKGFFNNSAFCGVVQGIHHRTT